MPFIWRHDTQTTNTLPNDIQHNDTQHSFTNFGPHHYETERNNKNLIKQKLYVCFTIVLNVVRAERCHLAHLSREVLLKGKALYN